jgi:glycosyltransferase involved in cell wall biosynthesis
MSTIANHHTLPSQATDASANTWPRILILGSSIGGGGAERRFGLLLQHLFDGTADGIALRACSAPKLNPGQNFQSLGWQGKLDYGKAILRLRRVLARREHDAVVSLGLYSNVVLWAASRALRDRPALVMTEITRPYTESTRFSSPLAARIRQPLYRISYRGADLVAANSEDGRREIIAHYGGEANSIVRIPNLIERDRVAGLADAPCDIASADLEARPFRICLVARLDPIKRVDTLLRAAHALSHELDWSIDLVGEGPHRPHIEALVDELSIRARVRLHGWRENPYPVMKAADVTVLCSEYEGFSNTVLESMVIGTPVITSYCSQDAREMVAKGAALGFEIGDWQGLRDHLTTLKCNPEVAARLASAASAFAERHHLINAVREYEELVRNAIELMRRTQQLNRL